MAISTNDPHYRAEYTPDSIARMGEQLCRAYGVGPDAFGGKGNTSHDYGYHRSRNWVLLSGDSRYGTHDYSVQTSRDHGGSGDAVSAFDFTPAEWGTPDNRQKMVTITKRMRAAARANDPRLATLREIAGTEDGRHVVTFKAQGGADLSPFDSSHLDHVHGSFWRDSNEQDHQGIVDVMLGTGGDEDDMGASWPPIEIKTDEPTSVTLVETEGGGADPRPQWLRLCNDTGGRYGQKAAPAYALRVMGCDGHGGFAPVFATECVKLDSGRLYSVQLKKGITGVSLQRCALDAAGNPVNAAYVSGVPAGGQPAYDGHLTLVIERGPVVH